MNTAVQLIVNKNFDTQEFNELDHPIHLKVAEIRKFVSVNLSMEQFDEYMSCEIGSARENYVDKILKLI
jgi:hypothetical protein